MITRFGISKVYRALLVTLIAGLICGTVFYLLHKEREIIETGTDDRSGAENRARDIIKIEKFMDDNASQVAHIEKHFSVATNTVDIIENIESLGKEYNTELVIRSAEENSDEGNLSSSLELTADVSGSWNNVFAFLQAIEREPHLHTLRSIELSNLSNLWRASVVITVPIDMQ